MIRMALRSRQGGASGRPCSTWCPEALPTVPGSQGPSILGSQGPRVPGSLSLDLGG